MDHEWRCIPSLKLTKPLKMGNSKRKVVFQSSIFRCELSVSGTVLLLNESSDAKSSAKLLLFERLKKTRLFFERVGSCNRFEMAWYSIFEQWKKKSPWFFWVLFFGDEILLTCVGNSINHEIKIPMKQAVFFGECHVRFFLKRGSCCCRPGGPGEMFCFLFRLYQGLCLRGVCQGSGAGDLFGKASRQWIFWGLKRANPWRSNPYIGNG